MQVDHGPDLVLGTDLNYTIKVSEPRLFDDSRIRVILEMSVIDLDQVRIT